MWEITVREEGTMRYFTDIWITIRKRGRGYRGEARKAKFALGISAQKKHPCASQMKRGANGPLLSDR